MTDAAPLAPLHVGMEWFPTRPGGLNRYVHDLFTSQRAAGIDARLLVVSPAGATPPDIEGVVPAGSTTSSLPARAAALRRAARPQLERVDVVDAHFAMHTAPLLTDIDRRGLPLVVHFHGPWAAESLATGSSARSAAVKVRVERHVYSRATRLVTLSQAFADLLTADYAVDPARVRVVPPGVDTTRFFPGPPEPEAGTQRWVVAARRLVPRMGLDTLIDAVATLPADLHLALIGEGADRDRLGVHATAAGVADRVSFLGRVGDAELADWYRRAAVVVLPSHGLEGFGLAALEALACGAPVVGTDAGGLPELLRRVDPRLLVPPRDSAALARALAWAVSPDGPDRAHCARVGASYTWASAVAAIDDVYREARAARSRKKVVWLDHCARLSGAELAMARIIPALTEVDSHVVLGEDGPLADLLREEAATVEVLPFRSRTRELHRGEVTVGRLPWRSVLDAVWYSVRLARRLRALRPDVVHGNTLKSCLYGGVAARLARLPFVWHARDRIAEDYLPAQAARFVRLAARVLPSVVVANSGVTLGTLGVRTPAHVIGSPVIHDPVDLELLGRTQGGDVDEDVQVVGMVGRLSPWKGQDVFLRAFAEVFAGTQVRASLVGSAMFGEDEYEAELRRLVDELGIPAQVEFRGFRGDIAAELHRLDLLVHCSLIPEPFGQVVIEGMAAGLPVVASAGGPSEVIEHGRTGWLLAAPTVADLAAALRTLSVDASLRRRLGEGGRETAKRFVPEVIAAQLDTVYAEAIAGASGGRQRRQRALRH